VFALFEEAVEVREEGVDLRGHVVLFLFEHVAQVLLEEEALFLFFGVVQSRVDERRLRDASSESASTASGLGVLGGRGGAALEFEISKALVALFFFELFIRGNHS
jgi:hypothetical protein